MRKRLFQCSFVFAAMAITGISGCKHESRADTVEVPATTTDPLKVQVAPETLRRSTAAHWKVGTKLNLERAMRLGDRLGGHWVQGHVDAVGAIRELRADGGTVALRVSLPSSISPFFVEKGSVCIDGISLTVTTVDADSFSVMLIPETQQRTSLSRKHVGDSVNLEADIIGKYVARMVGPRGGLTLEQLKAAGLA